MSILLRTMQRRNIVLIRITMVWYAAEIYLFSHDIGDDGVASIYLQLISHRVTESPSKFNIIIITRLSDSVTRCLKPTLRIP